MCGFIALMESTSEQVDSWSLRSSLERMRSRGPDDEGIWRDEGVTLGHRRLAILDLHHRAAQPMHSPCGRSVAVLNGEIYNFAALRVNLQAKGSVELRTPLVDTHPLRQLQALLAAFARFPGKGLLVEAPARTLPREIVGRRKSGFGIPEGRWLGAGSGDAVSACRPWALEVASAYQGGAT